MNKILAFAGASLLTYTAAIAQLSPQTGSNPSHKVWVFFTDKGTDAAQYLAEPSKMLSAEALALRQRKGIAIDNADVPVDAHYVAQLREAGCQVLATSKWLNAAAVELPNNQQQRVENLCFVKELQPVNTLSGAAYREKRSGMVRYQPLMPKAKTTKTTAIDYGDALVQNEMLQIPAYHAKGFTGRGVRIAVFDAGFDGADTIAAFDSLWAQKRILKYRDFVDNDESIFRNDSHGTMVLSTIAANVPGSMVGTAPHASFYLCRTEQSASETKQEEYNWMKAMEWVDSLGVDIIHSSLGYARFDPDGSTGYKYEDMNGHTAIITKAALMAARKGIIVTSSAGNEGNDDWHYITAPCDADSILCIGAVTRTQKRSGFSSFGPSADGRVKPDVVAMGSSTTVYSPADYVTTSDGTSFSGPIMGGFVACLKQAHPKRSNIDIIRAVRLSGDQFSFPDSAYGYGIPNVLIADSLLRSGKDLTKVTRPDITAKPQRGGKKAAPKPLVFASNTRSKVNQMDNNILTVITDGDYTSVYIMRDKERVVLAPGSIIKVNSTTIAFEIYYLLPGEHYLHIETPTYQENIKFNK